MDNIFGGKLIVTIPETLQKRNQRECIGGIGEEIVMRIELIFSGNLNVVCRLRLPVLHGLFFHTHERGSFICLEIAVTVTHFFSDTKRLKE